MSRVVLDGALAFLDAVLDSYGPNPRQVKHGHGGASVPRGGAGHGTLLAADNSLGIVLNCVEAGEDFSRAGLDISLLDVFQSIRDPNKEEKRPKLNHLASAQLKKCQNVGSF